MHLNEIQKFRAEKDNKMRNGYQMPGSDAPQAIDQHVQVFEDAGEMKAQASRLEEFKQMISSDMKEFSK